MHKLPLAPLALLALCACAPRPITAEAVLSPARGHNAAGTLSFTQQTDALLIQGAFKGLSPGAHGLHILAGTDCQARDAASRAHLNPLRKRHGQPGAPASHLGDLPMLTAGPDGAARFSARMGVMTLDDGPAGILGHCVAVSEKPDNFTTQPDGDSGANVACGVIRLK